METDELLMGLFFPSRMTEVLNSLEPGAAADEGVVSFQVCVGVWIHTVRMCVGPNRAESPC